MYKSLFRTLQYRCLFLGIGMGAIVQGVAQQVSIDFIHLTVEDGLPNNTVNSVTRDHEGYLWFATENGVSRYDGYTYANFRANPKDPASLSSNITYVVYADHQQRVWVGTEKGLDLFNARQQTFDTHFLNNIPIRSIYQDRGNHVWFGTDWGLYLFQEEDSTLTKPFPHLFRDSLVTYNTITTLAEDHRGSLWIGTVTEGAYVYSKDTHAFSQFCKHDTPGQSLTHNYVRAMTCDRAGRMWMATYGGGLNMYDPETNTCHHYTHQKDEPNSLASDLLTALWEDEKGNLWVGTDGRGVDIFNPAQHTFRHVPHAPQYSKTLSNNVVRTIQSDGRGGVWIGMFSGGLNFYNQNVEPFFHHSLPTFNGNASVTSFAEDDQLNLWVGTDGGGLCYFNRATDSVANFYHREKDLYSLPDNRVLSLLIDHTQTLWVGTYLGGVCRYEPGSGRFIHYQVGDGSGLNDNIVWTMCEDHQGRLWIGTNNGLHLYHRDTGAFTLINTGNSNISNDMIRALYEDREDHLWVGTQNGLNVMRSPTEFNTVQKDVAGAGSLSNNWIRTICQDKSGTLWVGTFSGGLNGFYLDRQAMTVLTESDGLPDNVVSAILTDLDNNIWVATGRGLARVDAHTTNIRTYAMNEGLQDNQFNLNAGYSTRTGEFLLGSVDGFTRFRPDAIGQQGSNPFPPPVVLTDLKIFNKSVVPGAPASPLVYPINQTDQISLPYHQSVLTFEFSALNFVHPQSNQYAYRLLGFEDQWNYVGNKRSATYTNLKPGTYQLQIKAANNAGVWNEEGKSVTIVITPPFWETWWFYTCMGMVFMAVVAAVYNAVRKRIRERMHVNRVIAELQMKALISQMNPHFMFNCLTSIQELVTMHEQRKAMHYLTRFSHLLRIVLESSDKNYTLLADELTLLEAYLELESLRFDGHFHYNIRVDDTIDAEELAIPCFLIQPFVENGLWHGLMHKTAERNMLISFTWHADDVLLCMIDDNGVGRQQAAQMQKNIKAHKSLGIKITNDRLSLMKEEGEAVDMQIIDKVGDDGRADGTTVILKLPVKSPISG